MLRAARVTTIYFLLAAGSFSAWHRVRSDEVWHWYEGEPLELLLAPPDLRNVQQRRRLGPVGVGVEPAIITVPADWWQAARPLGSYSLCGCTVAPGFEFEDFAFLRDHAAERDALRISRAGTGIAALDTCQRLRPPPPILGAAAGRGVGRGFTAPPPPPPGGRLG